ncbi:MAG: hypothetical protein AB8G16_05585 [Gammaproteobacteria bacterium]
MADTPTDNAPRSKATALILVAVAALAAYLLLLRQWPGADASANPPSMVLPLLGFCIALCAGIAVGLWWPSMRSASAREPQTPEPTAPDAATDSQAAVVVRTDDTPTVSALMEEEHIIGATPSPKLTPEPDPEINVQIPDPVARDTDIEKPTAPALHPSVAIDDLPRDEALTAKDEVIRSLENIVKENRDRWADFEQDRDALEAKINNLKSELRIAHQIIENGGDDQDVFTPPQVLSRA